MSHPKINHQKCGSVAMAPPEAEAKSLKIGFEYGCSCPKSHLALRFYHQPASGVDGTPFPGELWERSSFYHPLDSPLDVAGIKNRSKADLVLDPVDENNQCTIEDDVPMTRASNPWRDVVLGAPPVTAKWFVLHDTCGGPAATAKNPPHHKSKARKVHLFVGPRVAFLNRDFSVEGTATKFEEHIHHHEFAGKMIHCELENLSNEKGTPAKDPYGARQYELAALAYIFASYRAGEWLTVTAHIVVDLGIYDGHSDPRGFDYARYYRIVSSLVGMPAGTTYGLLKEPTGHDYNLEEHLNTFPAQYEPLRSGVVHRDAKKKGHK